MKRHQKITSPAPNFLVEPPNLFQSKNFFIKQFLETQYNFRSSKDLNLFLLTDHDAF
jgi:hypothetical protein